MADKQRLLLATLLVFAGACWLSGCKSVATKNAPPSPQVDIRDNTPAQVRDLTVQVFQAHGYVVVQQRPDLMVFEQPASKWRDLAYRGWSETPVWIRVKASATQSAPAVVQLGCRAYMVEDKGSPIEQERSIGSGSDKAYQKILDEVASKCVPSR